MSTCVCSSICWALMKLRMNIIPAQNANKNTEVVMQGYYVIWAKVAIRICISVEGDTVHKNGCQVVKWMINCSYSSQKVSQTQ